MFYYLNGTVAVIEPGLAVIDCGGVGYACRTTTRTLSRLTKGEQARLYTYCSIREDAWDIYGFAEQNELNCFKLLIGITGVGPKAALSILSANSPEDLALAVVAGNEKALTVAPGIGKKIAQRILLELKDKLGIEMEQIARGGFAPAAGAVLSGTKAADVSAALTVLGYNPSEIGAAMRTVDMESLSVEEIIREILKKALK